MFLEQLIVGVFDVSQGNSDEDSTHGEKDCPENRGYLNG